NAWTFFADKDILAAETLIDNKEFSSHVAFLSQQAIEKYLKAFLAKNKVPVKKTHDLLDLYSEARKIKDMNLDENLLQDIKDLYVETRYPYNIGLFEEGSLPTIEEAKTYLDFAKNIASIIKPELVSAVF
ncbi:MAG: HEPN domain-containing protein, partial [Fibromonadaceae bacterium]|nr:HEPN domain-containing protein [Fibromonadaceae bacterium]